MAEPLVLINLFSMPADAVDGFIANWPKIIAPAVQSAGFRGTRLHRALEADTPYPVVNIARWDSVEDWEASIGAHFSGPARDNSALGLPPAQPALYQVVHVT